MAQRIRRARPGTWHHVYNRGIGKRVIFATRADYVRFKTLMACSVRRGEIEIHAFCLLGTHFHLLVRVPQGGDLSRAMGRIQNAYTRWFNRRNRRDGPLFRGRLRSKPVTSTTYWVTLWRYIELNPVSARICKHPAAFEHSSARYYATGRHPRWLTTTQTHAITTDLHGFPSLAAGFMALIGSPLSKEEEQLVQARLRGVTAEDPTDDLLEMTSESFRQWAATKALNADGLKPSLPLAAVSAVLGALNDHAAEFSRCPIRFSRKSLDAQRLAKAGLLHELTGMKCEQIANGMGATNGTVSRWIRAHRRCVQETNDYARISADIAKQAIAITHGRT
jgi:REP element-mobilizing transposase RayT